jgi:hypothetical protein
MASRGGRAASSFWDLIEDGAAFRESWNAALEGGRRPALEEVLGGADVTIVQLQQRELSGAVRNQTP